MESQRETSDTDSLSSDGASSVSTVIYIPQKQPTLPPESPPNGPLAVSIETHLDGVPSNLQHGNCGPNSGQDHLLSFDPLPDVSIIADRYVSSASKAGTSLRATLHSRARAHAKIRQQWELAQLLRHFESKGHSGSVSHERTFRSSSCPHSPNHFSPTMPSQDGPPSSNLQPRHTHSAPTSRSPSMSPAEVRDDPSRLAAHQGRQGRCSLPTGLLEKSHTFTRICQLFKLPTFASKWHRKSPKDQEEETPQGSSNADETPLEASPLPSHFPFPMLLTKIPSSRSILAPLSPIPRRACSSNCPSAHPSSSPVFCNYRPSPPRLSLTPPSTDSPIWVYPVSVSPSPASVYANIHLSSAMAAPPSEHAQGKEVHRNGHGSFSFNGVSSQTHQNCHPAEGPLEGGPPSALQSLSSTNSSLSSPRSLTPLSCSTSVPASPRKVTPTTPSKAFKFNSLYRWNPLRRLSAVEVPDKRKLEEPSVHASLESSSESLAKEASKEAKKKSAKMGATRKAASFDVSEHSSTAGRCPTTDGATRARKSTGDIKLNSKGGLKSPSARELLASSSRGSTAAVVSRLADLTISDMNIPENTNVVRAHLPNDQWTTVPVMPGMTIQEALEKAMNRRQLPIEYCIVETSDTEQWIDWQDKIDPFFNRELTIKSIFDDQQKLMSRFSHSYAKRTFLFGPNCEVCGKFLFSGYGCALCGIKFHGKCAPFIERNEPICRPLLKADALYGHLLEVESGHLRNGSSLEIQSAYRKLTAERRRSEAAIFSSRIQVPPLPPLPPPNDIFMSRLTVPESEPPGAQRGRSTSTPNVKYNLINLPPSPLPLNTSLQASRAIEQQRKRETLFAGSPILCVPKASKRSLQNTKKSPGSFSGPELPIDCTAVTGAASIIKRRPHPTEDGQLAKHFGESLDDWEIPETEIVIGAQIGTGSFGTVYSGQWHGPVALKKLKVADPTAEQLLEFKNELSVLRRTRHVNVVLFMGCISRPELTIVTQWCDGSSLYKHLHVLETFWEIWELLDIARQTAQGMDYLHAKNIIHRDLKSHNIFMNSDSTVKIGDFGLATVKSTWTLAGVDQTKKLVGTLTGSLYWMSPEIMRIGTEAKNPYSFQSDVYAFGIVLFELVSGKVPFNVKLNKEMVIYSVGHGLAHGRPSMSGVRKDTPRALVELMKACTEFVAKERPLFNEILQKLVSIYRNVPKIKRSLSEPSLAASVHGDPDFPAFTSPTTRALCPSPKSPANIALTAFSYYMAANV